MGMMPWQVISMWVRGVLSVGLLVAGPWMIYRWYEESQVRRVEAVGAPSTQIAAGEAGAAASGREVKHFEPQFGWNRPTALLAGGVAATLWALPKGPLTLRRMRRRAGADEPRHARGGEVKKVMGAGGETLHVEVYGPVDAPPVVLTHGWSLDSTEWYYAKKALAGRFRLIAWDLPGLGRSEAPADRDFSLQRMARDLDAVIGVAGGRPVVLAGHSIGGMIQLTYAKLLPGALGTKVTGMVLTHTTYTNPVKTAKYGTLLTALQGPVIVPLMYVTIALSPLVRLMNVLSYWNGSSHRSSERTSFSGNETRGQLDFGASFMPKAPPAVVARGMLGMLKYDATDALKGIRVPVLVVAGDGDPLCLPGASERMRAEIPGAELVTLSPARHLGLIEHHERYAEAVGAFVEKVQGRAEADLERVRG